MQTGKGVKSSSGATAPHKHSDLESRLEKLESIAHEKCDGGGSVDEERVAALEQRLNELSEKIAYKLGI